MRSMMLKEIVKPMGWRMMKRGTMNLSGFGKAWGGNRALGGARCTAAHQNTAGTRIEAKVAPLKEPRVGVGVIVLRHLKDSMHGKDVLLIKRGKPPSEGKWSFPGGSQELGETILQTAIREVEEETGLKLREYNDMNEIESVEQKLSKYSGSLDRVEDYVGLSKKKILNNHLNSMCSLLQPKPFTAVDVIEKSKDGKIEFHYAIIEVAALPKDYRQKPRAGDDALDARWFPVTDLSSLPNLVPLATDVVAQAVERFSIPIE